MAHQDYLKPIWFEGKTRCPVTGFAIGNVVRFAGRQPGSNFSMEMATLGERIILIKTAGYMRSADEDEFLTCFEDHRCRHVGRKTQVVAVEDYSEIQGADAEARKKYVDYFKNNDFLLGGIIFNLSPLFRISFNIAKRLQIFDKEMYAETSYESAICRAITIINQSGIDTLTLPPQADLPRKSFFGTPSSISKNRYKAIGAYFRRWYINFLSRLNRSITKYYSDALLKYVASIDWQTDGASTASPPQYKDPAVQQVFDAIGFIKSEVDRLIQDRLAAEAELKSSEARYRQLVEHAQAGIMEFDFTTRRIFSLNEALLQITEYTRAEMLSMNPLDLMTEESREIYEQRFDILAAGGTLPYDMAYQVRAKSGTYKWVLFNTKLVFKEGRPEKASVVLSDITEMKRIESQLLEYQKKLKGLSIQLSKTQETERRKLASRLHDSVSQELFVAQLQLNALAKKMNDEDQALQLNRIRDQIQKIIKDTKTLIFDLSPPVLYDFGLRAAIESLGESIARGHGISIQTLFAEDTDNLDNDINIILYRSINELIHNTLKHACADNIFISASVNDQQLLVDFQDDGIGFDAEHAQTNAADHKGFGLFDIREKINHLGGSLEIDSVEGSGARVSIKLPIAEAHAAAVTEPAVQNYQ